MALNNAQGGPRGWIENWRASLWQFDVYRTTANPLYRPTVEEYESARAVWMNRPVPPRNPRRMRGERVGPLRRIFLVREINDIPSLDGPMPGNPSESYLAALERCDLVRNFFTGAPALQYIRSLGYGGNGVAIRYRYYGRPHVEFVMKVAIDGWESNSIRTEEKLSKKMARAAHCVQVIPRSRIGIPENNPFRFDMPVYDDSSESSESSGEESRDDEPSAKARDKRTRREMMEVDPEAARRKRVAHDRRVRVAERAREDRYQAVMRRRAMRSSVIAQGTKPPQLLDYYDEDRKDFLLLEFCQNGDLETLLYKVACWAILGRWLSERYTDVLIPTTEFMHLIRAFRTAFFGHFGFAWYELVSVCSRCLTLNYIRVASLPTTGTISNTYINLRYPPRKFHPRRKEDTPGFINGQPCVNIQRLGKMAGDDLFEELPDPRRRWASKRFVHFDIDPQNILISDVDVWAKDAEHKLVPRLKLADFGCAEEVKRRKRNSYYYTLRDVGKYGYFAPEQFSQDWNYITKRDGTLVDDDGPEISEQPIAGNYGPAMNIWGIAVVMWQLMTHMRAPVPPQLQVKRGLHANLPYNYCPVILTEDKYDGYDLELRQTVARCMAQDPQARPSPGQLLRNAKRGINKRFDQETDGVIQQWVERFIYDA
ncbi:kinase-like domain-containing protein [Ustulina deusta]|nr:kinase-like domain-containing protein [Ustulina deusta]